MRQEAQAGAQVVEVDRRASAVQQLAQVDRAARAPSVVVDEEDEYNEWLAEQETFAELAANEPTDNVEYAENSE